MCVKLENMLLTVPPTHDTQGRSQAIWRVGSLNTKGAFFCILW